jgi:subtilisin family serine protease
VITVGNFDDRNTVGWGDDLMSGCSSWRDPSSTHSDREKPEVSAPGTNINSTTTTSPWTGGIGSGTSYAAPMVTGTAALMMQRNTSLQFWPEAVKAILMVSAVHNIEGATRLSEFDGAGAVVANRADLLAGARRTTSSFGWNARSYDCASPANTDVAVMSLTAGVRTRVAIAWDQNPAYGSYASQPSADLDLHVLSPTGALHAASSTWDNTYEIVDFTPTVSGNHTLRVHKYRCDLTPRWLGFAWRAGS